MNVRCAALHQKEAAMMPARMPNVVRGWPVTSFTQVYN